MDNLIDWVGSIALFLFGITMMIQGHFIFTGKYGYKHSEREKERSIATRRQIEKLIKDK